MPATYVFDLDGTLFHHGGLEPVYESPKALFHSTQPFQDRCRAVADLMQQGHAVFFLTGRGEGVRAVTMGQLRRFVGLGVKPHQLLMQVTFTGFPEMVRFKAHHLRRLRAASYVGDHEADREAAELAGVPFTHADDYALPLVVA